jgi:cell shape-determining protein MreC
MVLIQKLIEDYKSLEEKYKVLEDGLKSLEEKFSNKSEITDLKEEVTKLSKQPKVSKPTEQKTKVLSIEDKAQHLLNNIKNLK